ncbi:MAG: hypothetical protein ACOC2F_01185 [Bacteroidota bacterium]
MEYKRINILIMDDDVAMNDAVREKLQKHLDSARLPNMYGEVNLYTFVKREKCREMLYSKWFQGDTIAFLDDKNVTPLEFNDLFGFAEGKENNIEFVLLSHSEVSHEDIAQETDQKPNLKVIRKNRFAPDICSMYLEQFLAGMKR